MIRQPPKSTLFPYRRSSDLGAGIRQVIAEEPKPDAAIVLKPGWSVLHEEVGLAWFRITVRGSVNYTGIRHKGPYLNPILAAARSEEHTAELKSRQYLVCRLL